MSDDYIAHRWIRTHPLDGRWCELCAQPEVRWNGDPCSGEGAARRIEAKLMAANAELSRYRAALDPGNMEAVERAAWALDHPKFWELPDAEVGPAVWQVRGQHRATAARVLAALAALVNPEEEDGG